MKNGVMTLEEISRAIKISRTTIYKVLNHKGKVSPATRRTVLDAVERYNYKPNLAAKNLARRKRYDVAFVGFDSPQIPYAVTNLQKGIRWAEKELRDFGLHVTSSLADPRDEKDQVNRIHRLVEEGIQAFVIYPSHIGVLKPCIDELVESGKLVVTVNRDVPECRRHAYFGCDHYRSGLLAAEVLARMIPPSGELGVVLGGEGIEHNEIEERYKGLQKKMERFPAIRLLEPIRMTEGAGSTLEYDLSEMINNNRNLGGILDLTNNLELVSRVVYKNNNKVRLVGFDLCESVKNHMIRHSIDAVIFSDMPTQGYLAVKNLYGSLVNGSTERIQPTFSKLEVVYEGNLDFFI